MYMYIISFLQEVLKVYFSPPVEATLSRANFDLLLESLSMYLRLAMHRGAESGGCEVVRERLGSVREWSDVVIPCWLQGIV